MKSKLTFIIFLLLILSAGTVIAQSWSVGDRCLANWSYDEYLYPGTIIEIDGNSYHIQYDDGDREWLSAGNLWVENLGVGSYVSVNWLMDGYYYFGTIEERIGDVIFIQYDDGDVEWTTIAAVRIMYGK
jgi:hypothetical protein